MGPTPGTLAVTSAALLTQFVLLLILVVGALLFQSGRASISRFVALALFTVGPLVFSQDVMGQAGSVLGWDNIPSFSASFAVGTMFVVDILFLGILIVNTGGSRSSPFTPALFLLPTYAILLRESPVRLALYLTLIVVVFAIASLVGPRRCYGLRTSSKEEELLYETIAFGFVSVACLVLGAVLGLLTRNY